MYIDHLLDARVAALCGILFTAVVSITADEPAAVPPVFYLLWHRYLLFQELRRVRSSGKTERFWEVDMTKIEP